MVNWFLLASAGFILLIAAIILWAWVSTRERRRQREQRRMKQQVATKSKEY